MGCFFACFRVRDDRAQPHRQEAVISKNKLSSLFASEGREESPSVSELRDEAIFRVETKYYKSQVPSNTDLEDSKFQSWQTDPRRLFQELEIAPGSPESSPVSCISSVRTTERISICSDEGTEAGYPRTIAKVNHNQTESSKLFATPLPLTTNTKKREKLVQFQCNLDAPSCKAHSSGNDHQNFGKLESQLDSRVSKQSPRPPRSIESHLDSRVSKQSPRPTPLKLSDEMQTPGTVFPATVDTLAGGKNRIRSQYVYSEMNHIQDYSRWKVMKEDASDSDLQLGEVIESSEQPGNPTAKSEADNRKASQISKFGSTDVDRPIIGMAAAHWRAHESSDTSHKWWDGNGIPNSTAKYKEDQKVSWHATPFEERLEKALSEEGVVPPKKHIINGRPIVFDYCEESDSSLSHVQASAHSKSVVTF